jgi:flagellar basal body rod protein FlgG
MIKGFYAAASAMVMNANRQNTLSHNIANLETPGFKQILNSVTDFKDTAVLYSPGNLLGDSTLDYIGNIGLGSTLGASTTDFSQGGLETTNNPYDVAIQGDGFFKVRTSAGDRYTRDGRFLRDADNNLVTTDGYAVLDANNQPITLAAEGEFAVSNDGTVYMDGTEVAQLGLAKFKDPATELTRAEGNLFAGPAQSTAEGAVSVAQYTLEMSNASPTQLMTQLVEVARSYEAAAKMVQNQDELLGQAISTLRVG